MDMLQLVYSIKRIFAISHNNICDIIFVQCKIFSIRNWNRHTI